MVGRSDDPTGPLVDQSGRAMLDGGGTEVLATSGDRIGPGGADVYSEGGDGKHGAGSRRAASVGRVVSLTGPMPRVARCVGLSGARLSSWAMVVSGLGGCDADDLGAVGEDQPPGGVAHQAVGRGGGQVHRSAGGLREQRRGGVVAVARVGERGDVDHDQQRRGGL